MFDYASEIRDELHSLLERFGPQRRQYRPDMPFWRLKGDGFWELHNSEQCSIQGSRKPPEHFLRFHVLRPRSLFWYGLLPAALCLPAAGDTTSFLLQLQATNRVPTFSKSWAPVAFARIGIGAKAMAAGFLAFGHQSVRVAVNFYCVGAGAVLSARLYFSKIESQKRAEARLTSEH